MRASEARQPVVLRSGSPSMAEDLAGRTARELIQLVQTRQVSPVMVVRAHLDRIAQGNAALGAFQTVTGGQALADARALDREDLARLPLAGLPVAIKDNIDVRGLPTGKGLPGAAGAAAHDHEIVRRLRAAGAIVLGKTRVPELSLWATSDGPDGAARSPWDLTRTAGGSSGGSAAAVAAGMVPVAHGTDGLGSIRIPAAVCGVVGLKAGSGLLPSNGGVSNWYGMAENGLLATTVDDAALVFSVMAADPALAVLSAPTPSLRVAVSTTSPLVGVRVDPAYARAALATAGALASLGHRVVEEDPPYAMRPALAVMARWCAAAAESASGLDVQQLPRRTRGHVRAGTVCRWMGLLRPADAASWRARCRRFFERHDVLLTPVLAQRSPVADGWTARSWLANVAANIRYAPFAAAWNLAECPGVTVPAGTHDGTPLAVQLVAAPGNERLLLALARQIEVARPWPRHAPARDTARRPDS